jgi:hypothetical protein
MEAPKVDKHNEKWCGYFKNEDEAQKHLDEQLNHLSEDNLIISAKKEFGNAKVHGLLLYKFTVITADKIKK